MGNNSAKQLEELVPLMDVLQKFYLYLVAVV